MYAAFGAKKQPSLLPGDSVLLPTLGTCRAWVRYVGQLHFASGFWVGVELLDPSRLKRKRRDAVDKELHSGEVGGVKYFSPTYPKSSIFVRRSECLLTGRQAKRRTRHPAAGFSESLSSRAMGGSSSSAGADTGSAADDRITRSVAVGGRYVGNSDLHRASTMMQLGPANVSRGRSTGDIDSLQVVDRASMSTFETAHMQTKHCANQ